MPQTVANSRPGRWNYNTVIGCLLIALGITVYVLIPYQVEQPLRLVGETTKDLDPTVFPKIVAALICFSGVLLAILSRNIEEPNLLKDVTRPMLFRVVVSLTLIFSYSFLLQPLGFVISSVIIIGLLSTYYGNRNVLAGVLVSLFIPLFIFNLFTRVLKVSLPEFPYDLGVSII